MNTSPATIDPEESLASGLKAMGQHNVRHLVVMRSSGDVVGILSDRDLALFYDPSGMTKEIWDETKAGALMSRRPVTIGSNADIEAAAKLLIKTGFSALPVVDNGTLVGILTERDYVRRFKA